MTEQTEAGRACMHSVYARELSHRAANALQSAMAAVHLGKRGRPECLDAAMRSLSSAADLHRMLGTVDHVAVQAGPTLWNACRAVIAGAGAEDDVQLHVRDFGVIADLQRLRPLLMIAVELVGNSLRHAFDSEGGRIIVTLADDGETTRLAVEDSGRCGGWSRPGGQGHDIVDSLASSMGGGVERGLTVGGSSRVTVTVKSISLVAGQAAGNA